MEREVAFALPVSIAGGWVAAASPILAAFQTSVEEDEGSLPRLSRRESKGLTQPTSVEGDEDGGGREREARLERAAHAVIGDGRGGSRHATPKRLWGLFVSRSDTIFREMEGHDLQSLHLLSCFLPMRIILKHDWHSTSYPFDAPRVLLFFWS